MAVWVLSADRKRNSLPHAPCSSNGHARREFASQSTVDSLVLQAVVYRFVHKHVEAEVYMFGNSGMCMAWRNEAVRSADFTAHSQK